MVVVVMATVVMAVVVMGVVVMVVVTVISSFVSTMAKKGMPGTGTWYLEYRTAARGELQSILTYTLPGMYAYVLRTSTSFECCVLV